MSAARSAMMVLESKVLSMPDDVGCGSGHPRSAKKFRAWIEDYANRFKTSATSVSLQISPSPFWVSTRKEPHEMTQIA